MRYCLNAYGIFEPYDIFGEQDEIVVYTNICYICKRVFQETEQSEVCSQKCLDFETIADVCANQNCRRLYELDPCEPSSYCSDDCRFEVSQARKKKEVLV